MLKNKKIMLAARAPDPAVRRGYTMTKPKPVVKDEGQGHDLRDAPDLPAEPERRPLRQVSVALELAPGQSDGAARPRALGRENGAGTLPEEPLVREIVTNAVTSQNGETLVSDGPAARIKHEILQAIKQQTDVKVEAVLFPDLTVQ